MSFPILETQRLKLVEINLEHTQKLFSIFTMDEVTKYYGMDRIHVMEEAVAIIDSFKNSYLANRGIRWGMILRDNDEFIGTVGLNNLLLSAKRTEIGYEIHPSYWRNGYTSEALEAVLRYCFEDLSLARVGAVTFPENTPSIQLLIKKFGFQQEGILRNYLYQNKLSHDACVFSLVKDDWKHSQVE